LNSVQVEIVVQHTFKGSNDHWRVLWEAASHDAVYRHFLYRGDAVLGRNLANYLLGIPLQVVQNLANQPGRGRHHGQAIGPAHTVHCLVGFFEAGYFDVLRWVYGAHRTCLFGGNRTGSVGAYTDPDP
jgi:hypothetical protein